MTLVPIPISAGAAKAVTDFLERFGGISSFAESILDVPSGYLKHWHQTNLIRWYDKLHQENETRKSNGRRPIPPSLLMPALQKIAIEDNDDMLTMWANLFANLQDSDRLLKPDKVYVHLLSEMQSLDAKILNHAVVVLSKSHQIFGYQVAPEESRLPLGFSPITSVELANVFGVLDESVMLSALNLSRVGCLLGRPHQPNYIALEDQPIIPQMPTIITEDATFCLTSLGSALVNACSSPTLSSVKYADQV